MEETLGQPWTFLKDIFFKTPPGSFRNQTQSLTYHEYQDKFNQTIQQINSLSQQRQYVEQITELLKSPVFKNNNKGHVTHLCLCVGFSPVYESVAGDRL